MKFLARLDHSEASPNFIENNGGMTESHFNAVISISSETRRGEISSNRQISLSPEARRNDKKKKSVIGNVMKWSEPAWRRQGISSLNYFLS